MVACESIARWFSVNENLAFQYEIFSVVEHADTNFGLIRTQQFVVHMRATHAAKATFGPFRTAVASQIILTRKSHAARVCRHEYTTGQSLAHLAMTGTELPFDFLYGEGHGATLALSLLLAHFSLSAPFKTGLPELLRS
jgi:hypothetical protein